MAVVENRGATVRHDHSFEDSNQLMTYETACKAIESLVAYLDSEKIDREMLRSIALDFSNALRKSQDAMSMRVYPLQSTIAKLK